MSLAGADGNAECSRVTGITETHYFTDLIPAARLPLRRLLLQAVILSEVKNLSVCLPKEREIPRFAQNDKQKGVTTTFVDSQAVGIAGIAAMRDCV